jgi:hypothetical protein
MPEEFIKQNFTGIFTTAGLAAADITLLNHPAQPTEATFEEKLKLIYSRYLPLLKNKLRTEVIINNIAALLKLSQEATGVLINNDLNVIRGYVEANGLSAVYYSDDTFTVATPEVTDDTIDLKRDGLTVPVDNFSAVWQAYLTPPSSGDYILTVRVRDVSEFFELFMDDEKVLSKASGNAMLSLEYAASLNSSSLHKLKLRYSEGAVNPGISLSWNTVTSGPQIIDHSSLYPLSSVDKFCNLLKAFHRASKFISGFKLTDKEVIHFVNNSADFASIDFKVLLPVHWQRINEYTKLRNSVPQSQSLLTDVFAASKIADPIPSVSSLVDLLYLATGWDVAIVNELATYYTLTKANFINEVDLARIFTATEFVQKTGLSVQTLESWAKPETDFDKLHATANLVRSTVKAKYEDEDWMKLAGDLSNKIRENQKQALINYLLTDAGLLAKGISDADGLFEYFLIDVQMGACMDTSRIVQASAAVQLFIQRCLLNLESNKSSGSEKGVSPDYIDKDRWAWMKYYRVWEVNRKIFITPENWLEPEWRDDRSEFFKELESELTQNDITDRSVETAFRTYLLKLNTVANLDVCGMYQENDTGGVIKKLHVFAHTHNAPYQFFYRTCSGTYKWDPWQKVQLDIRLTEDGINSGVHLLPLIWKERLFVFWTEFVEKKEETKATNSKGGEATFSETFTQTPSAVKERKYWEMRLAWSEFADNKWSTKQLSKEFLKIYSGFLTAPIKNITLKSSIENDVLHLTPYIRFKGEGWYNLGEFMLIDIQSPVIAVTPPDMPAQGYAMEFESSLRYNNFYEKNKLNSTLEFWDHVYLQNPADHKLVFSNNILEKEVSPTAPFFFHDADRSYFVKIEDIRVRQIGKNPESHPPIIFEIPEKIDDSYFSQPLHIPKVGPDDLMPIQIIDRGFTDPSPEIVNRAGTMEARYMMTMDRSMQNPQMMKASVARNNSSAKKMMFAKDDLAGTSKISYAFNGAKAKRDVGQYYTYFTTEKGFEFRTFYHPYSSEFVSVLNRNGIKGLMNIDTQRDDPSHLLVYNDKGQIFEDTYDPNFFQGYVKRAPATEDYVPLQSYTFYKENICFDVYGANSCYNWELFFHAPLYIATRLSKNGRYEEAMKWFHYIFDPTTDEMPLSTEPETARFWKTLPFKTTPAKTIEEWFASIQGIDEDHNGENDVIQEWRDNPFKPFSVARNRPLAFMKNVVIKYVENLRLWADSLFRIFNRETVYEAIQLYVMANHILGPKPEFVPKRGEIKAETYFSLKDKWDDFSNAIVELENVFPYSSSVSVSSTTTTPALLGVGEALYFCIPSNEKLLEHWDIIADRLYKIRHCMDIDGVERKLALFAPAIDPAMLINAAAQGLSLGSILSDLGSPPPIYRFHYLLQRANEFISEVKSLGSSLLAVLEKKDAEELGRMRSAHETMMLELLTAVKERQVLDAKAVKESLIRSRETAKFRFNHYKNLVTDDEVPVPAEPSMDSNINSGSQLPATTVREIKPDVDVSLVGSDESGLKLINKEKLELDLNLASMLLQTSATFTEAIGGIMNFIPTFGGFATPFGCGITASYGGSNIAGGISGIAKIPQGISGILSYMAAHSAKIGTYVRREQDWTLQANLASREIMQLDKQIISADIKIQVTEKELSNHKQQIENAKQVEQFLKDRFTNQELYQWMKEQLFFVYKQSYNMAFDMAKKVESCYRFELGKEPTNFIQYGYWDNTMQGLAAGEKLQLAMRQMEKSYIEENKRELELTKNVSMALLNPLALLELKTTGKCFFSMPEELFDLDYQGHYFRRIKSVSISIPCIAGPHASVNCTLRLLKNAIRINTSLSEAGFYEHMNEEGVWTDDDRFRENNIPVKAIATSNAQRDSGMFELNFRDDRYLPFEGGGVISDWKVELTQDPELRLFDHSTISDVIFHVNFTAREDAGLFRENAINYLKSYIRNEADLRNEPLMRMFSLRHDFSTEWNKFLFPAIAGSDQEFLFTLARENFPFFVKDRSVLITKIELFIRSVKDGDYKMIIAGTDSSNNPVVSAELTMPENSSYGNTQKCTVPPTSGSFQTDDVDIFKELSLKFKHSSKTNYRSIGTSPRELEDVFVALHYRLGD